MELSTEKLSKYGWVLSEQIEQAFLVHAKSMGGIVHFIVKCWRKSFRWNGYLFLLVMVVLKKGVAT